jgi:hypothetical protein
VKQRIFDVFRSIEVHRCLTPLFETVSDGCVVLVARGYGEKDGHTGHFKYSTPADLIESLKVRSEKPIDDRHEPTRQAEHKNAVRLGDVLSVGIGCVTGDSQYFLLTESERLRHSIPLSAVIPVASKARHLKSALLRVSDWQRLLKGGERIIVI